MAQLHLKILACRAVDRAHIDYLYATHRPQVQSLMLQKEKLGVLHPRYAGFYSIRTINEKLFLCEPR